MIGARVSVLCTAAIVFATPVVCAQDLHDLSRYREYQMGMTLAAVAKQAGMRPSDARVLHRRPDLVEELEWLSQNAPGAFAPRDPVRRILFSFSSGQLFRIAVSYDWDRTEGLTADDMIEAISATYGLATLAATDIVPSVSHVATNGDKIVAHWEDREYSLDLLHPSYASTFGLTFFSKRLDALARAAGVDAVRISDQGAPARAIERQRTQEAEHHARQEKARQTNKASFRP